MLYAGDFSQALVVRWQQPSFLSSVFSFTFITDYIQFPQCAATAAGYQIEADMLPGNVNHHGLMIGKTFCDISKQQTCQVCLFNALFTLW